MIHYALRCAAAHEFDGWFNSSISFDDQATRGLLSCPICADTQVQRALMAPLLGRGSRAKKPTSEPSEAATPPSPAPATPETPPARVVGGVPAMPDHVRAVLQRLRAEVETKCEYVGPAFAQEARLIHEGEKPARAIYGETTPDQAEALAEDGIPVSRIPWVPRADG